MKNRESLYPGRIKLTPVDAANGIYDLVRADEPQEEGTPLNKKLLDFTVAACGVTAGTATALTLDGEFAEGFTLTHGAKITANVHVDISAGATLNIDGTGAKPIINAQGLTPPTAAGGWITLRYDAKKDAYVQNGEVILPEIHVYTIPGDEITITDGTFSTSFIPDGSKRIAIPHYGTWTVTSANNSVNISVDVDTVRIYEVYVVNDALDDNTWKTISDAAAYGVADNYWDVGDCKAVSVNGMVGTQSISGIYYVYILGFAHNDAMGTIDFGTFKTAASGGKDICLIDGGYESIKTDGSKLFNMNHSVNTNSGGWKGCDLRYDVLGSTKTKGNDAVADTATNPVPGTLMAALPSDLRAVMKPMTIYTDNTGGGTDTASNVTTSVDYLPLLAEFEIFGARHYANSAEKNYQKQYTYFSSGNSSVKYRHSAPGSAARWWERSPYYNYSSHFCYVTADGGPLDYEAGRSYGLAPIFRV